MKKTGWIISLVVAVVVAFGAGVVVGNSGILHKNTENVSKTASVDGKKGDKKDGNEIETQNEDSEKATDQAPEEVNELKINGVSISIPVTVQELRDAGFNFEASDLAGTIEPGYSNDVLLYSDENTYVAGVWVYNSTDTDIELKNGSVGGIYIQSENNSNNYEFAKGIQFGMTESEITAVLGDNYEKDTWDGDAGEKYFSLTYGDIDEKRIEFYFDENGKFNTVEIRNDYDLQFD